MNLQTKHLVGTIFFLHTMLDKINLKQAENGRSRRYIYLRLKKRKVFKFVKGGTLCSF